MKVLIVIALVGILVVLGSAGAFMLRRGRTPTQDGTAGAAAPANRHMARALALRVAISVALFLFVLLSWAMGWVRPTGLPTGG